MEEFRASLRKPEAKYTLPAWHESELKNREKKSPKSKSAFTDWSVAKSEINNSIK